MCASLFVSAIHALVGQWVARIVYPLWACLVVTLYSVLWLEILSDAVEYPLESNSN
jgi:diacylglycerol kinase